MAPIPSPEPIPPAPGERKPETPPKIRDPMPHPNEPPVSDPQPSPGPPVPVQEPPQRR